MRAAVRLGITALVQSEAGVLGSMSCHNDPTFLRTLFDSS